MHKLSAEIIEDVKNSFNKFSIQTQGKPKINLFSTLFEKTISEFTGSFLFAPAKKNRVASTFQTNLQNT